MSEWYGHRKPHLVIGLLEALHRLDSRSISPAGVPYEDEEIGEDEERAAAESREWPKHNKAIPHEEVLPGFP